jgi:putative redox protein
MQPILTIHEGGLRCRTVNKNGDLILTDTSKDHGGKGEAYSPVDLTVVALSSCILTVMGIVAKQHKLDTAGSKIAAEYEMAPGNRIGKIHLNVTVAGNIPSEKRPFLEKTIRLCPVHNSLHPEIQYEVKVEYL